MNILLINPMASRKNPRKGRQAHFPVGLGYIAAYLLEHGYKVKVLDNEVECLNKFEIREYIAKSNFDFYGISAMSGQYNYVKGLARLIKVMKNKPIILGGPLATYTPEAVLKSTDIDVCVIGEGEETIVDLLRNYDNKSKVTSIAYKHEKTIISTKFRKFKLSRDQYPFPAYKLFNMEPYFKKQQAQYEGPGDWLWNKELLNSRNLGISTGIGCPYHCKFCSRSVVAPRLRSIEKIIDEIKYCVDVFKLDGIRFLDDLLIINQSRTLELCEKIKPLKIYWSGQARTNTLTDELAFAMKKSGCVGIGFGYESGSDVLLRAMNKGVSSFDHKRATMAAKNNNIAIRVQLLFGYPGESKDTIDETINFFKEIKIPPRRFNILTPLPGSDVYVECLKNKKINDEVNYLNQISKMSAGFGSKKVLLNLTDMSDEEFEKLLKYAEEKMIKNYEEILSAEIKYIKFKKIYHKLLKYCIRAKKIFNFAAWKNKILNVFFLKEKNEFLNREDIEKLFFEL